ncbi:unnamed protein product [Pieris macdunnoughi]|uniref:Uncharacterized protein n=1 Tax=Pieris macdunnoughi TaxID=345717 RepID=A0A821MM77_9NEOP|nr:unnamed protein product [Pieris macdunnoughi]
MADYSIAYNRCLCRGRIPTLFSYLLKKQPYENENAAFKKKTSKLKATAFPPSCRELQQRMRRATYITQIWCNANVQNPSTITPNSYGWELINMKYEFHWFDGEEYPVKFIDIVEAGAETDNDANESTDAERDGEGELTSDAELTEYETDNESDEDSI